MPDLMDFDPQNPIHPVRKDWPKAQDLGLPSWAGKQLQEAVQEERACMSIDEALGDLRRGHRLDAEVIRGVVRKFLAEGGDELDKRVGEILNYILHPNVRGAWAGEATMDGTTLGAATDVHIGDPVALAEDGRVHRYSAENPDDLVIGRIESVGADGNPVVVMNGDIPEKLTFDDLDKPETQNGGGTCQT